MSADPSGAPRTGWTMRPVLLVGVLAVLTLAGAVALPERQAAGRGATPVVDYAPSQARMRAESGHQVWVPRGLRAGWRPIATEVSGGDGDPKNRAPMQWRLGFLGPSGEYAAVAQSSEPAGPYTKRLTSDGVARGGQKVAGASWARFLRESKDQRSLVRTAGPVTIVISGTATYSELAELAAALRSA